MNILKKVFKQLLCNHDYIFEGRERKTYRYDDPSEPCYIINHVTCERYRCKKCGKRKTIYK